MKLMGPVGLASARLKRPSVELWAYSERGIAIADVEEEEAAVMLVEFVGAIGKMGSSGWSSVACMRRLTRSVCGRPERYARFCCAGINI